MPSRPPLGRSVLCAWAERHDAFGARKPQLAQSDGEVGLIDPQPYFGQRPRGRSPRFFGELRVALGHQRPAFCVELMCEVEEPVAPLANKAGAQGDSGEERDQRRLEGVRKYDRLVVAAGAEAPAEAPARQEPELAVTERRLDDFVDLRHAPEHGRGPARGERVDHDSGKLFFQARKERLGEQRVADPARGDDEDFRHERALVALWTPAFADVAGAAVGTKHLARLGDVEKHPRVHAPHRRLRRGAMQRKIGLVDLDDAARLIVRAHQAFSFDAFAGFFSCTGESQSLCLATLPATTSKKSFWILVVTGPREPEPITRASSSRIGVTSAAVPVKKASSAI